MTTRDPQRAAGLVVSAERDMRRALKALDAARHLGDAVPALEKTVMLLSHATESAKMTAVMLLRNAAAEESAARAAKRTKR